jgi:hypothetical protein
MKAFLKGIIALAPITCITPALIAVPHTSYIQTTTVVGASITNLHIQVDLAQKPYKYDLPTIDDTTVLLNFKQSIIENVHENKSVDLKINELLMYYQAPNSDRLSVLSNNTQTLAEYEITDDGIITVIINGTSGFSDL